MNSIVAVVNERNPSIAIQRCLGLLEEQGLDFRDKGTVLIKPNLALPTPQEERPETTSPELVAALVREMKRRGANRVLVGDEPAWGVPSDDVFRVTGMGDMVLDAGGELCRFEEEPRVMVPIPDGHLVKELSLPQCLVDADYIINFPKMKTSIISTVTLGLKNLFGCILFEDRKLYHREVDLAYLLVDIYKAVKPDLTIVDGIIAMEGYGAHMGDPVDKGLLLGGNDIVAVDAISSISMGLTPMVSSNTQVAVKFKIGTADPEQITCVGDDLSENISRFELPNLLATNFQEGVYVYAGGVCPGCKPRIKAVPPHTEPGKKYGVIIGREPLSIPDKKDIDEWWLVGNCGIKAGLVYLAQEIYENVKNGDTKPLTIHKIPGCPPLEWYSENIIFKNLREKGYLTTPQD